MKYLVFFFVLILTSCTQDHTVLYKYQIKSNAALSPSQASAFKDELKQRLDKFGFREAIISVDNNTVEIQTLLKLNRPKEADIFESLFESNKFEIKNTFKISDPIINRIEPALWVAENFLPTLPEGTMLFPPEIIGTAKNKNELSSILKSLSAQTSEVDHLQLLWSESPMENLYDDEENYALYLINTQGNNSSLITEKNMTEVSFAKDQFRPGTYVVNFQLDEKAKATWSDLTTKASSDDGRAVALILNGRVCIAPRVNAPIVNGRCSIAADYTKEEAEKLVRKLSAGRLAYNLDLVSKETLVSKE